MGQKLQSVSAFVSPVIDLFKKFTMISKSPITKQPRRYSARTYIYWNLIESIVVGNYSTHIARDTRKKFAISIYVLPVILTETLI